MRICQVLEYPKRSGGSYVQGCLWTGEQKEEGIYSHTGVWREPALELGCPNVSGDTKRPLWDFVVGEQFHLEAGNVKKDTGFVIV